MRRRTPDLPGVTEMPRTPQIEMPQGSDAVASRIADFGNIVQNFTGKVSQFAGQQTDLKSKATEMVLKTNIDNSMRAFARRSLSMQNPKVGLPSFHQQADNYIKKLIEGGTGVNYQIINAYANNAKDIQSKPLETQLRKQTKIDAKSSILASFDSNSKDLSQIIKSTPYEEAVTFHSFDKDNRDEAFANAPTIAKAHYTLSQTLNQIDAGVAAGLFSPMAGDKLKKKIIDQSNDEMLTHAFHLALENGHGQQFIDSFASRMDGEDDAAYYAKHLGQFKKIQSLFETQHKISESQARADITSNLNNIALGKDSNPFVDSMAEQVAFLAPDYAERKAMHELSGGIYTQLTAGTRTQAINQFEASRTKINELIAQAGDNQEAQQKLLQTKDALEMAGKNAINFFDKYHSDPVEYINKEGILNDVATNQSMWDRAIAEHRIPENLRIPQNSTLRGLVAHQAMHGIPIESARIFSNAQATEAATKILSSQPVDAVAQIQNLQAQYGEFAANVFQDMIKHGGLPKNYGILQSMNPRSPYLQEVVTALKHPESAYDSGQKSAISKRISDAMDFASNRAHPDAGFFSRLVGTGWETLKEQVTGREFDPGQYSSGLFGRPAIFSDRSTTPDLRIKAYFESLGSTAGFNTGQMLNDGKRTLESMTNYYVGVMGLNLDEAIRRASDALTGQYSFMDYKDNTLRLPRGQTNFNDISSLLVNTDKLLPKIRWSNPQLTSEYTPATRADSIAYFNQNIKNGHWATHPTDKGLIWVGASGVIPLQENGNPLFISFESMKDFNPQRGYTTLFSAPERRPGETLADVSRRTNEVDQLLSLFNKNNTAFNEKEIGLDTNIPEHKRIKDSYSRFELATNIASQRFDELVDRFFTNHAQAVRRNRGGK